MAEVFISYDHDDLEYVDRLAEWLRNAGISSWLDRGSLRTGDKWKEEITKAIEECGAFIVVMSPRSLDSEWVNKELTYAEDLKKPIFPLLLEGKGFPLLADIHHEDVQDGQMPRGSLLVTLSRARRVENQPPEYSVEQKTADIRLLYELWDLINTPILRRIREQLPVARVNAHHYQRTIIEYNHMRVLQAEKHFLSSLLEQEFVELDRLVQDFKDDLWTVASQIMLAGELRIVPDYMLDAYFPPSRLSETEKQEKRRHFYEVLGKLDIVIDQQQRIVRLIKRDFPEFRFETGQPA